MSAANDQGNEAVIGSESPGAVRTDGGPLLEPRQWRQVAFITLGALAVFTTMRLLPTGTNLSHMDFRVDAQNPIETCDPANPQFIPVVSVPSPVKMTLVGTVMAPAGTETAVAFRLDTASGKPIAPEDLEIAHTKKLHLMVIDPTLTDYQHVHPTPGRKEGEWDFTFTPRFGGTYRLFADFTPVATNRSLYANTDLAVVGPEPVPAVVAAAKRPAWAFERDGYRFTLEPGSQPVRVRQPEDLTFVVTRLDGGDVPMGPVMGAYAHLVAFDDRRSGFAHLHPKEIDLSQHPDAKRPTLHFKITIPGAGRYVIWAQVNLGGTMAFAPFWFDVVE